MPLPQFEYFAPTSVAEACSLLSQHRNQAKILAGGTDLLVKMKQRRMTPRYVINLKTVPGLDYIRYDEKEGLRIGTLATVQSLKTSNIINRKYPILHQVASEESTVQIRNRATIGGNLANASPAADAPPALIALGASLLIASPCGERTLPLEDFFKAPGETSIQSDEIITEVRVPPLPPRSGGVYLKHSIRSADIAIVGVAAVLTLDGDSCNSIKIVLGAVAPTPIRAKKAESLLRRQVPTDQMIERAARIASEEAHPINDIRGYADYRTKMVKELTVRAIKQALAHAKWEGLK